MKKAKLILIFVLINIIIVGVTVFLPIIPALNFYRAYHYDIPNNENSNFVENASIAIEDLQTQEGKEAFAKYIGYMIFDREEILYGSFSWVYIMLGMFVGAFVIIIGIILKYKSSNKIYSKAFITAGIIVVIAYIFILSILLQEDVYYTLWG